MKYQTLYFDDGKLRFLDQSSLPQRIHYIDCRTDRDVLDVIKTSKIQGSSSVAIACAYGMVLAIDNLVRPNGQDPRDWDELIQELAKVAYAFASAKPTSGNVKWVVRRMLDVVDEQSSKDFDTDVLKCTMLKEVSRLCEQDRQNCKNIGKHGLCLIKEGSHILTYSNGGYLSSTHIGTALAPVYTALESRDFNVYCCETITAWELKQSGLTPAMICDSMAATFLRNVIKIVIVPADRVAANGDIVARIGTYGLAVLAKYHKVPFYVATSSMSFDLDCQCGDDVPIEQAEGVSLFDITPGSLLSGIITEKGILSPVNYKTIERWFAF